MKKLKQLSFVGKLAGFVFALNVIPFVDPAVGVVIVAAAALLKNTVNRIGDLLDNGQPNESFRS
jgi:predicted PurR-regulated permease PerM